LQLAWQCERWGALPETGGVRDQPAGLLDRIATALNVYQAMDAWKNREGGKEGDWKKEHKKAWEIIQTVNKLRRDGKHN
jgi:hypothetical protein